MEPTTSTTPSPVLTQEAASHTKRTKIIMICVAVLVLIGTGLYMIFSEKKATDPVNALQDLTNTSQPVTESLDNRAEYLREVDTQGTEVPAAAKKNILNQLQ